MGCLKGEHREEQHPPLTSGAQRFRGDRHTPATQLYWARGSRAAQPSAHLTRSGIRKCFSALGEVRPWASTESGLDGSEAAVLCVHTRLA